MKLEILTSITTKENLDAILREFQGYVKHPNNAFVCATVRAVGRVADALPEIADRCLEGVMHLLYCNKAAEVSNAMSD